MRRFDLSVTPDRLFKLLGIKGGQVGMSLVPQVLPTIDLERQLLSPATLTSQETGDVAAAAIGFQGFTVPQDERWTIYHIGALTDTLDADQTIRLQTAIRYANGQVYATDVTGVAIAGAAGGTNRGGVGFYPPGGVVLPPGFGIGVNVAQITVGAALAVSLFVGVLRTVDKL